MTITKVDTINGKLTTCRTQLDFSIEEIAYNIKTLGKVERRARLEPSYVQIKYCIQCLQRPIVNQVKGKWFPHYRVFLEEINSQVDY